MHHIFEQLMRDMFSYQSQYDGEQAYVNNEGLQLSKIILNDNYRNKWNADCNDYVVLTKNGELVSNSLYRVGGMSNKSDIAKNTYFLLLKHVEAFYDDKITKDPKRKPHLESRQCIIDKHGVEKVVADGYKNIYLVENSVIYRIDSKYYNVETGGFYGYAHDKLESDTYLFLGNYYDEDKSKRGVMKIHKKNGTFELFPKVD